MMPLRDGVTAPAPREWAERSYNVKRWTIVESILLMSGAAELGIALSISS
jgi:hypothetical protein